MNLPTLAVEPSERRASAGRLHWLRIAFFTLFPLAMAGGILLSMWNDRRGGFDAIHLATNRDQAIAAAKAFLQTQGVNTTRWKEYCRSIPDRDVYLLLKSRLGADVESVRPLIPPATVQVMLVSPNGKQNASVTLSFQDRVLGYDLRNAGLDTPSNPLSDSESMAAARLILDGESQLVPIFGFRQPEVSTMERSDDASTRLYTWHAPLGHRLPVDMEFSVALRNGRLLSRSLKGSVDKDFAAHQLHSGETGMQIFGFGWLIFILVAIAYSIIRYTVRSLQKEVSHSRTFLMALLLAVLLSGSFFTQRDEWFLQAVGVASTPPMALIAAVVALMIAAAALLVGIGYGSGEGDVRETFPGKLTSLDALVLGKVFSRNVGSSVIVGVAFAGWLLLAKGLLLSPFTLTPSTSALNAVKFPFAHAAWFTFLTSHPAEAIMLAVVGLLQPLAFVSRYIPNPRTQRILLVVFAMCAVSGAAVVYLSGAAMVLVIVVMAAGLLLPFLFHDVLAAVISLASLGFVDGLTRLAMVLPGWAHFAWIMAGVACVTLALEVAAWRRGRLFREEEVRPEYARHIAERQAWQEEVHAAREAQLRLLPVGPPPIQGLTIFASCFPARVVGGDFYDFFVLSEGRLGIFIAEGGNRGMASALSIALAKGYLMHTAQGLYSPTEVILKLESTLGSILEAGVVRTTVAYAVIDTRRGSVRYARTGSYPKLVVASLGESRSMQSEREVPIPGGHEYRIHEGEAELASGDSIVLYTDGIARRIAQRSSMLQEDWVHRLAREGRNASELHLSLFESIGAHPGKVGHELEDDLTAIVIRCDQIGTAVGVVA